MKHITLIFILIISIGLNAQTVNYLPEGKELHETPTHVYVYLDRSQSMKGFFPNKVKASTGRDVTSLLQIIKDSGREVVFFGFDTKASNSPLKEQEVSNLANGDTFNQDYNVYSSAIESLKGLLKDDAISVMITDGVPSLTSGKKGDRFNEGLNTRLIKEKNEIHEKIKNILNDDPDNRVILFRYFAEFNGYYYPSDASFKASNEWKGERNIYAIVFAKENQLQYVDELFFNQEIVEKLDAKKLSPSLYSYVKNISSSYVVFDKGEAIIRIFLEAMDENAASQLKKDSLSLFSGETKLNPEAKWEGNRLEFKITIPENEYSPNQTYSIRAKNGLQLTKDFFEEDFGIKDKDDLQYERGYYTNDKKFHDKTFRLYFLTAPLIKLQEKQAGFEIDFSITQPSKSWVSSLEPMFGAIPPRASLDEINRQLAPLWLFLFRWLTPIFGVMLVYGFLLNYRGGRITNPKNQKIVWWSGFVGVLVVVAISSVYYMFTTYIDGARPSLGYQLKHLIYNPLFALLIYIVLSVILSRRPWCTTCSDPIPF